MNVLPGVPKYMSLMQFRCNTGVYPLLGLPPTDEYPRSLSPYSITYFLSLVSNLMDILSEASLPAKYIFLIQFPFQTDEYPLGDPPLLPEDTFLIQFLSHQTDEYPLWGPLQDPILIQS